MDNRTLFLSNIQQNQLRVLSKIKKLIHELGSTSLLYGNWSSFQYTITKSLCVLKKLYKPFTVFIKSLQFHYSFLTYLLYHLC